MLRLAKHSRLIVLAYTIMYKCWVDVGFVGQIAIETILHSTSELKDNEMQSYSSPQPHRSFSATRHEMGARRKKRHKIHSLAIGIRTRHASAAAEIFTQLPNLGAIVVACSREKMS